MPTFTHNRVKNGVNGKQYSVCIRETCSNAKRYLLIQQIESLLQTLLPVIFCTKELLVEE